MKTLPSLALTAFAAAVSPALALDLGNGFALTGDVELEYLRDSDDDEGLSYVDVTLGWRSQAGGELGFGFDVTLQDIHVEDSPLDGTYVWAAGVLTTPYADISVGRPLPVLERMFPIPQVGASRYLDLRLASFGGVGGSLIASSAVLDDTDLLGLTAVGTAGSVSYGVGYHRSDNSSSSFEVYELGVVYRIEETELFLALEHAPNEIDDVNRFQYGVRYRGDGWSIGGHYQELDFIFLPLEAVTFFAEVNLGDRFTLGAQAFRAKNGPSTAEAFGVTGEYAIGQGGFGQLGYFDGGTELDRFVSASIGWRF